MTVRMRPRWKRIVRAPLTWAVMYRLLRRQMGCWEATCEAFALTGVVIAATGVKVDP